MPEAAAVYAFGKGGHLVVVVIRPAVFVGYGTGSVSLRHARQPVTCIIIETLRRCKGSAPEKSVVHAKTRRR